jgi:hypothetical protein
MCSWLQLKNDESWRIEISFISRRQNLHNDRLPYSPYTCALVEFSHQWEEASGSVIGLNGFRETSFRIRSTGSAINIHETCERKCAVTLTTMHVHQTVQFPPKRKLGVRSATNMAAIVNVGPRSHVLQSTMA